MPNYNSGTCDELISINVLKPLSANILGEARRHSHQWPLCFLINWTTVYSAIPNQADSVQVQAVKTQQTDLWLAASDQLAISQKAKSGKQH